MENRQRQENADRTVSRSWWLLITVTIFVALLGFVAMFILSAQIAQDDPKVDAFPPSDIFVQPDAEWNTSVFVSRSPETREIRKLTWLVSAIALGIFIIVEGLLIYAIIRYRRR